MTVLELGFGTKRSIRGLMIHESSAGFGQKIKLWKGLGLAKSQLPLKVMLLVQWTYLSVFFGHLTSKYM